MVVLPDLWRVVRSAIGLTYVILLRLSGGVPPEGLKTFWRCRGVQLDDIHSVLCKCFDSGVEELCAQAALLDHLPWSCLDAPLVSLQERWWRMSKCRRPNVGARAALFVLSGRLAAMAAAAHSRALAERD